MKPYVPPPCPDDRYLIRVCDGSGGDARAVALLALALVLLWR